VATAGRLPVPAWASNAFTEEEPAENADRLHPVFATLDPVERARLITELLTETAVRPALHVSPAGHPRPSWSVTESRNAVLAPAAVALRQYLGDHDFDRLGICAGPLRRCLR
jgi:predicted RNA-binding Zn ribbon-like protein